MKKRLLICTIFILSFHSESSAFSFSIKPYLGYAAVKMAEVDENNRYGINSLSYLVSQPLPLPEPFDRNLMIGFQIDYHLENQYFMYFGTYYYRETSEVNYNLPLNNNVLIFSNNRDIELFEFSLGVKYFLGYSSWRRINFYLSGGVGFAFGGAYSDFFYRDGINTVDNQGNFNSSALTANFCAGIRLQIFPLLSLVPEVGYRLADLQQMEGVFEVYQNFPNEPDGQISARDDNYRTEANYNFSGYYFNLGISFHFEI